MAFNGSGRYDLPAGNPVVSGTTIESDWANDTTVDIANALTNCITKDGQTTITQNIPFNSKKITGLGAGSSSTDSVRFGQVIEYTFSTPTAAETAASVTPSNYAYPPGDVRRYGADNGGADYSDTAFADALASNARVYVPAGTYKFASGLTIPSGKCLEGEFAWCTTSAYYGTVLLFDNSVTTCVTLSEANLTTAALKKVVVTRTGTPPSGSFGVKFDRGQNNLVEDVWVRNHANNWYFYAQTTQGIHASLLNCYSDQFTENDFYIDSWPEIYVLGGRHGSNGDPDNPNAFIYITGTSASSSGIGPNTIVFTGVHFNGKSSSVGPAYLMEFDGVGTPQGNQVIYKFSNCHVEGVRTAYFKTTSTAPYLAKLFSDNTTFNSTTPDLFAIDAATQVNECLFSNSIISGPITLSSPALINGLRFTGCEIGGTASITGKSSAGNNMRISNCNFIGALTVAGTWSDLYVVTSVGGSFTNNSIQLNAASNIFIDAPGVSYKINGALTSDIYNTASGVVFNSRTARGSSGARTVSSLSDVAWQQNGWIHDGSQYGRCATIRMQSGGGTPGSGTTPGAIVFSVTPVGSETPTDYIVIDSTGAMISSTDNTAALGSHSNRFKNLYSFNAVLSPPSSVTPANNGDVTFELTNNTTLTFKVRGSDGTVRSGAITLS